jgi:hypothetical protein
MKDKQTKTVIEYLLQSEEYVRYDEHVHNKLHFNISRLIKDEIRTHKWIESGKGRDINWEYAVQEWMDKHYDEFIKMLIPKSRIKKYLTKYSKDFVDFVKFITIP